MNKNSIQPITADTAIKINQNPFSMFKEEMCGQIHGRTEHSIVRPFYIFYVNKAYTQV
jgi:hypothetical protein